MSRWESLLVVQEHHTRADQLAHRIETLPARAELAKLEDAAAALDRQLTDVQRRRDELARSQQRLEDEVASLTERANQAEKQLYSGSVTAPRELQALQDDVASIRRRIGQIEDDELEIMELAEAEAEIAAELAAVREQRADAAAAVPDDLWPESDRLRAQLGGVAIAR